MADATSDLGASVVVRVNTSADLPASVSISAVSQLDGQYDVIPPSLNASVVVRLAGFVEGVYQADLPNAPIPASVIVRRGDMNGSVVVGQGGKLFGSVDVNQNVLGASVTVRRAGVADLSATGFVAEWDRINASARVSQAALGASCEVVIGGWSNLDASSNVVIPGEARAQSVVVVNRPSLPSSVDVLAVSDAPASVTVTRRALGASVQVDLAQPVIKGIPYRFGRVLAVKNGLRMKGGGLGYVAIDQAVSMVAWASGGEFAVWDYGRDEIVTHNVSSRLGAPKQCDILYPYAIFAFTDTGWNEDGSRTNYYVVDVRSGQVVLQAPWFGSETLGLFNSPSGAACLGNGGFLVSNDIGGIAQLRYNADEGSFTLDRLAGGFDLTTLFYDDVYGLYIAGASGAAARGPGAFGLAAQFNLYKNLRPFALFDALWQEYPLFSPPNGLVWYLAHPGWDPVGRKLSWCASVNGSARLIGLDLDVLISRVPQPTPTSLIVDAFVPPGTDFTFAGGDFDPALSRLPTVLTNTLRDWYLLDQTFVFWENANRLRLFNTQNGMEQVSVTDLVAADGRVDPASLAGFVAGGAHGRFHGPRHIAVATHGGSTDVVVLELVPEPRAYTRYLNTSKKDLYRIRYKDNLPVNKI